MGRMQRNLGLIAVCALAVAACSGDDASDDSAADTGSHHATAGDDHHHATASDDHHATAGDDAATAGDDAATAGDDAATAGDDAATVGDDASGAEDSSGGDAAAETYCNCMLVNCHDDFHERYGEGDVVALPACYEAAAAFPTVGMDAMSGDSLECRMHFCNEAAADGSACAAALGDEICVD